MFLTKFLVLVEVANGDGGRRCLSNKVERAIEGIMRVEGERWGLSSGGFLWWDDRLHVHGQCPLNVRCMTVKSEVHAARIAYLVLILMS
jgi:hypothetical protein